MFGRKWRLDREHSFALPAFWRPSGRTWAPKGRFGHPLEAENGSKIVSGRLGQRFCLPKVAFWRALGRYQTIDRKLIEKYDALEGQK